MPDKKKAIQLMNKRTEIITRLTDKLEGTVKEAEIILLRSVIEDFVDKLDTTDGKIANTLRNKRLIATLDNVFKKFSATQGIVIASSIVTGIEELFQFNTRYFSAFADEVKLKPIENNVKVTLEGWLGMDEKGNLQENGYLSNLIQDTTVRNQVKNFSVSKIVGGAGITETKQQLQAAIVGDPDNLGAMQKYYRNYVYDLYSTVDRTASKITADKLDLNYAVYEGGLIKTSRKFCRARNGKVFTREEIADFDPDEAKQPGYNPFTDLGGYGCRHHLNWIPYLLAIVFRPDLKEAA